MKKNSMYPLLFCSLLLAGNAANANNSTKRSGSDPVSIIEAPIVIIEESLRMVRNFMIGGLIVGTIGGIALYKLVVYMMKPKESPQELQGEKTV